MSRAALGAAAAILWLLAANGHAAAQEAQPRGFYLGGAVGASWPKESDIDGMGISASADFELGWSASAAVGYKFEKPFRTELEFAYRRAQVDGGAGMANFGDVGVVSGMANALYDFRNSTRLTPYLGLGLGIASVNYDDIGPFGAARIDDRTTALAYQGIFGVGMHLSDSIDLYTDYRYFAAANPSFTTNTGTSVDGEYAEHRVSIGIRWSFGTPMLHAERTPPISQPPRRPAEAKAPSVAEFETAAGGNEEPTAAPAPNAGATPRQKLAAAEPSHAARPTTYRVYFAWDRAILDGEALGIVRMAAADARSGLATRIEATGHADRSGPAGYNMKLSMRRAKAVQAELVNQGVPPEDIAIYWKGETQPAVPTADGKREPRNRRVEIILK